MRIDSIEMGEQYSVAPASLVGLVECLGTLRLETTKGCTLDKHVVAIVPLPDEMRVDEPEAAKAGLVYHCLVDAVGKSDRPRVKGVTDLWPKLKQGYFLDPQQNFQVAPDQNTLSNDSKRRRQSNVSTASASSSIGGGGDGDGDGAEGAGGSQSAKALAVAFESMKRKASDAETKLSKLTRNFKNVKDSNDELKETVRKHTRAQTRLVNKQKSTEEERDEALTAVAAKSAEKNRLIREVEVQLKEAKLELEIHAAKRKRSSKKDKKKSKENKKKKKKKKSDNEESDSDSSSSDSGSDRDSDSGSDSSSDSSSSDSSSSGSDHSEKKKKKKAKTKDKKKPKKIRTRKSGRGSVSRAQ